MQTPQAVRSSPMAQSLNILPRTVASFYGSTVPRPYVVCDALGEVKQDRVAKPRVNAALVGACRALASGQACASYTPARAATPACRVVAPDKSPVQSGLARSRGLAAGCWRTPCCAVRAAPPTRPAAASCARRARRARRCVRAPFLAAHALARSRATEALTLARTPGRRHRNRRCTPRQAPRWCVPFPLPRALSRLFR